MVSFLIRIILEHFAFGLLIPVYIILLTEQLGLTLVQAGFVVSVTTVAIFVLEIPSGILADKIKRKYLLSISSILHLAAYTTLFFSNDITLISVSALLTGAGFAFASGAEESYVHDFVEKTNDVSFEKQLSRVSITDEVGTITGMLFSSFLLVHFNYSVLIGIAIFALSMAVAASLFLENIPHLHDAEKKENIKSFNYKKIFVFIIIFLLLSILSESGRLIWQPQLIMSGWSVVQLGYIYAIIKLGSIAGAYMAGSIKVKSIYAVLFGGVIGAVGLCIFSINVFLINLCGLALFLLAENFVRIHTTSFILSLPHVSNQKATILSVFSIINNSYLSISSIAIGVIASLSPATALMYVATIKTLTAILLGLYIFVFKQHHFD